MIRRVENLVVFGAGVQNSFADEESPGYRSARRPVLSYWPLN